MEEKEIFIAGAASIFGLSEIKRAFATLGTHASFVEAPFMLDYVTIQEDEPVLFKNEVSSDAIIIPLTEFWISYCVRTRCCLISDKALAASRSKKYLYELFASLGIDSVKIYDSVEQAHRALAQGLSVVVKPLGLCSGLGVEVVTADKKEKLDAYVEHSATIKTKNMRLMQLQNEGCMITEYVAGQEYSADCFYFKGRISVVRVCKKKIVLINDKPCVVVYQLVKPCVQIEAKLAEWMNVLFEKQNISFAQFDFIVNNETNRIVPVDFACRIGGGLTELLKQTGANPYADAIKGTCREYDGGKILTQLNYLSTKSGHLLRDDFKLAEGTQFVYKHIGDYVINNPSSVGSRTAIVIQQRDSEELPDGIEKKLLIDEAWIK